MIRLFFILSIIPILSFSQEEKQLNDRKFSIGISVAPGYSYRVLKPIKLEYQDFQSKENNRQAVDSMNSIEKGKLAFTYGISISYKFNNRFSLNSGFYYSDKGIKSKGFVHRNGAYPGYNIYEQDNCKKSKYYFYEIPVTLSYGIYMGAKKNINCFFSWARHFV